MCTELYEVVRLCLGSFGDVRFNPKKTPIVVNVVWNFSGGLSPYARKLGVHDSNTV